MFLIFQFWLLDLKWIETNNSWIVRYLSQSKFIMGSQVDFLSLSNPPSFSKNGRVGQEEQRGGKEMTNWENYFAICGTWCMRVFQGGGKVAFSWAHAEQFWGLRSKLSLLENNRAAWQIYITFHITFHIPAPTGIQFHCTGSRPLPSTT